MKRTLLVLLMALAAKGIAIADEIFDAKVVEYLEQTMGRIVMAFIGVDSTGKDTGFADTFLFIEIINNDAISRRLANQVKGAKTVSYEDGRKYYDY
jgi:hypothetical protein